MDERNDDRMERMFDFFILNILRDGPLHSVAIEQRMARAYWMGLAAERKGKASPGSVPTALDRLEGAGLIESERRQAGPGPAKVYFLTAAGKEQLELQWNQQRLALARFVEEGGLDDSFGKFLNRDM